MLKFLKKVFTSILVAYLLYAVFMFFFQRNILFIGKSIRSTTEAEIPKDVTVDWVTANGGQVEMWYKPANPGQKATTVIFAHGNGELIDDWTHLLIGYPKIGMNIALVEYPGYGRSGGSPSEAKLKEVFTGLYDVLLEKSEVDPTKIIGHGRSLGAGAITNLSLERNLSAMILEAPFTNLHQFTKGYFLPNFLLRDKFDNLTNIQNYKNPILLLHGTDDSIIPFTNSEELEQAAPNAILVPQNCAHNNCPPVYEFYWNDIKNFLESNNLF